MNNKISKSNKKIFASIITLLAFSIAIIVVIVYKNNSEEFISDLNEVSKIELLTLDGETYDINTIDKELVIINSWSTWCSFCTTELVYFKDLKEIYPEEIEIVAINRGDPLSDYDSFFQISKLQEDDLIFLQDKSDSFYSYINGIGMPETIFLNKDGNIATHIKGPMTIEKMTEIVEQILNDDFDNLEKEQTSYGD